MDCKWKDVEDLPMDREMNEKVLILSESTISGNTSLHVTTEYWNVFFDDRDVSWDIFDKKKKHADGRYAYGRLGDRKIPLEKIKGWAFADKMICNYGGKEEKVSRASREKKV